MPGSPPNTPPFFFLSSFPSSYPLPPPTKFPLSNTIQEGFEHQILLPQPPEYQEYRRSAPGLASTDGLIKQKQALAGMHATEAVFCSSSGKGLKVLVPLLVATSEKDLLN